MKTLYCNSFEVSHSKEAFCLILKFESPDGYTETVYVTLSPAGAKTLVQLVEKEMEDYEKEHGEVESWITPNPAPPKPSNAKVYVS